MQSPYFFKKKAFGDLGGWPRGIGFCTEFVSITNVCFYFAGGFLVLRVRSNCAISSSHLESILNLRDLSLRGARV